LPRIQQARKDEQQLALSIRHRHVDYHSDSSAHAGQPATQSRDTAVADGDRIEDQA
jgi:DnaJ-domain-containing protein 1